MTELIITIVFLSGIYTFWCFLSARYALNKVAPQLDAFVLEDYPEVLKALLVTLFGSLLKQTLIIQILTGKHSDTETSVSTQEFIIIYHQLSPLKQKKFVRLLVSMLLVNFRSCPLTWFIAIIMIVLFATTSFLLSHSEKMLESMTNANDQLVSKVGRWYINQMI